MKVSPAPNLQVNRFCQETGRFWSAQPTSPVRKPVGLVSTTDRVFRRATEVQVGVLVVCVCCAGGILLRKVVIDLWKDISCGRKFHQPPPPPQNRPVLSENRSVSSKVSTRSTTTDRALSENRSVSSKVSTRPTGTNEQPTGLPLSRPGFPSRTICTCK